METQQTTQTPSQPSMKVTSKHYVDSLETNIIQVARAFSLEFGLKVDPDAKKMTRDVVQRKINQLLTDQERAGLKALWTETVKIIANREQSNTYARQVYEALKTAGFDNV